MDHYSWVTWLKRVDCLLVYPLKPIDYCLQGKVLEKVLVARLADRRSEVGIVEELQNRGS